MSHKYLVGIDEVGRGPIAGPVSIGIAVLPIPNNLPRNFFKGIKDSKKLTPESREEWFKKANEAKKNNLLDFCVESIGNKIIDSKGISFAIKNAIKKAIEKLNLKPDECKILLDGSLKAPEEFKDQKTIIKGDEKEPIISLASIVAKVTRDKRMVSYSKKYSDYGFEVHKGYGTRKHYERINKNGLCEIHRRSFLTRFGVDKT
jgi:ribonuclease HII